MRIGKYEVTGELGRGGMGTVYRGVDPMIGRPVAIKTIHLGKESDPAAAAQMQDALLREARLAGGLSHSNIVVIYEVGQDEGRIFIAMEFVEGPTLHGLIARKALRPHAEVIAILRQAAEALDFAHARGIVHRDIKPQNILMQGGTLVKVTDFGIARQYEGASSESTGIMGTPGYMAPEQLRGFRADGRADQFALATIAFELLTGGKPFVSDNLGGLLYQVVHEKHRQPSGLNRALVPGVDSVFDRALAKQPEQRFSTCSEFAAALEQALAARPQAAPEIAAQVVPVVVQPPPIAEPPRPAMAAIRTEVALQLRSLLPDNLRPLFVAGALAAAFALWWFVWLPYSRSTAQRASPKQAPRIAFFRATPEVIQAGQAARLEWSVSGARSIKIDHGVGSPSSDNAEVRPSVTTTYLLVAESASGERRTSFASVDVREAGESLTRKGLGLTPKPQVDLLTAVVTPEVIPHGGQAMLSWMAPTATSVEVFPGPGRVAKSGNLMVRPMSTTVYMFKARGQDGVEKIFSVQLTVRDGR